MGLSKIWWFFRIFLGIRVIMSQLCFGIASDRFGGSKVDVQFIRYLYVFEVCAYAGRSHHEGGGRMAYPVQKICLPPPAPFPNKFFFKYRRGLFLGRRPIFD